MTVRYALTDIPYTKEDIGLGSLVPNIKQPNQDALFPAVSLKEGQDYRWRNQKNFDFLFELDDNSELKLRATRLFSLSGESKDNPKNTLFAREGRIYDLVNPKSLFRTICRDERARDWMVDALDEGSNIYFVVGYRTYFNAKVSDHEKRTKSFSANASLPVSDVVSGLSGGVAGPLMGDNKAADIDLEGKKGKKIRQEEKFQIPGERIFAIACRRVHFGWPLKQKVDSAKLDKDNVWVITTAKRGGDAKEGEERVIEADIEEADVEIEGSETAMLMVDGSNEIYYT